MKINLRFLLLLGILPLVLTDWAFAQLAFEDPGDPMLAQYNYLLVGYTLALSLYFIRYMQPAMRTWYLVVLGSIFALGLESYHGWGSWMRYPHVFSKLTILLYIFAAYGFYRRYGMPPLRMLVKLILLGIAANLAFFNRDALSLGAFLENERGFAVGSAYLLLFCGLLALNWYFDGGNWAWLFTFLACSGLIVFLQHRTVWIAMAISLPLNLLFLWLKTPGVKLGWHRFGPLLLVPFLIGSTGGIAAALENPDVVKKLISSIEDIQNPTKQGTGSWRYEQMQAYVPFVEDRPVLGWRLEGFELPVQFYNDTTDEPVWENGSGHHFHSFYLDRLFYFGFVGLLLVVLMPIVLSVRRLMQPAPFSPETAALLAFGLSSIPYGISYDWPPYLYGFWGLIIAALTEVVTRPAPTPPTPPRAAQPAPSPLLHHVPA